MAQANEDSWPLGFRCNIEFDFDMAFSNIEGQLDQEFLKNEWVATLREVLKDCYVKLMEFDGDNSYLFVQITFLDMLWERLCKSQQSHSHKTHGKAVLNCSQSVASTALPPGSQSVKGSRRAFSTAAMIYSLVMLVCSLSAAMKQQTTTTSSISFQETLVCIRMFMAAKSP